MYSIWPHENLDKRAEHREELFQVESWTETGEPWVTFDDHYQVLYCMSSTTITKSLYYNYVCPAIIQFVILHGSLTMSP